VREDLRAVWAVAPDEAYAVGGDETGLVLQWNGSEWSTLATAPERLTAVWTSDDRALYVAGERGLFERFGRYSGRPDARRSEIFGIDDSLAVLGLFGRADDPFVVAAIADPTATEAPFRGGVYGHRISLSPDISSPNPPDAGP
jgi:hypothetical protein